MKVGDLVNYKDSASVYSTTTRSRRSGGVILDSRLAHPSAIGQVGRNVNSHQVYWACCNFTEWVMERVLESINENR